MKEMNASYVAVNCVNDMSRPMKGVSFQIQLGMCYPASADAVITQYTKLSADLMPLHNVSWRLFLWYLIKGQSTASAAEAGSH